MLCFLANMTSVVFLSRWNAFQVKGIFRGGFTTLLRESIGNAVFFSVYEYVRYYMHLQLKDKLSDHSNLIGMGIGIVSGGLGGVAVSILKYPATVLGHAKCSWCHFLIFVPLLYSFGLLFCLWTLQKLLSRLLHIKIPPEIHFNCCNL